MFEVIIIGSGPAGVAAATYLKRFNRDVLVITSDSSTLSTAHLVENYYGFSSISGDDLYKNGLEQLKHLGVTTINESVLEIEFYSHFIVKTTNNTYEAKKVILATGKARNKLNVSNYKEYEMKGLSYCATCDGFFYRDLKIGIIGSGEAMLHELDFLKNISKDITIFTNGEELKLDGYNVVKDKIVSFYGENNLEGLNTENAQYPLDGVFVAIGSCSTFDFIKHLGIATDDKNNIIVDSNYQTNIPNLYAIGDAIGGILQITKAAYDGMMVAYKIRSEGK
jgi:thioredoxin reductase (NADPH)